MKKIVYTGLIALGILGFLTTTVLAADPLVGGLGCKNANMDTVTGIVTWASCFLMQAVVPLLFMLATVGFLYGVVKFYLNPEDLKKKEEGKNFIVGGLIGLFVMTSMWGIVKVLTTTFGVKNVMPQLPVVIE